MENQTQTLNEFLKEKGVSNDIRNKRMLATAFGIIFDSGSRDQEDRLLLALKAGSATVNGKASEVFRVEVAAFEGEEKSHLCNNLAEVYPIVKELISTGKACRTVKVTTITEILK